MVMRRILPALIFALTFAPLAGAEVEIRADPPRGYGWWIGDRLVHEALLLPPPGHVIDPASLPRPRAVTYWLNLTAVELREVKVEGRPGYRLRTEWQSFYAPLEPTALEVPPIDLRFLAAKAAGTETENARIPGWSFVSAPIRPILAPSTPEALQPEAGLPMPETGRIDRALAGFTLLAGLWLAMIAYLCCWWPFHHRPDHPLTRAARRMGRAGGDRGRVLALHRGLDAANGAPLLAADLDAFLSRRPEFAPLARELQAFFDRSAQMFFGSEAEADDGRTASLATRLARIERGRA